MRKHRGDEEFVEFASVRGAHLLRTAYLLTGDRHLAEDLAQEALGKVFVAWRGVARIDNPAAYAQTVLVRTYISHRRRRSAGEVPHAALPETASQETDVALRMSLMDGLARLAAKDPPLIVLRYWEDRSVDETASALGLTAAAVRNQSSRALARLREVLGPRFRELADAEDTADPDAASSDSQTHEGTNYASA